MFSIYFEWLWAHHLRLTYCLKSGCYLKGCLGEFVCICFQHCVFPSLIFLGIPRSSGGAFLSPFHENTIIIVGSKHYRRFRNLLTFHVFPKSWQQLGCRFQSVYWLICYHHHSNAFDVKLECTCFIPLSTWRKKGVLNQLCNVNIFVLTQQLSFPIFPIFAAFTSLPMANACQILPET